MVEGIAQAYEIDCTIEFIPSSYTVINDELSVSFLTEKVLPQIVDSKDVVHYHCMAGEDFSAFTNHNGIPGALIFVGTGNPQVHSDVAHHNAKFTIDEDTLLTGVQIHVTTALEFLNPTR